MHIRDSEIESIYRHHKSNSGHYTWAELVVSPEWNQIIGQVHMTGEALRKRVARWKGRANRKDAHFHANGRVPTPYEHHAASVVQQYDVPSAFADVVQELEGFDSDTLEGIDDNLELFRLKQKVRRLEELLNDNSSLITDDPLLYQPYPEHLDDTKKWHDYQVKLKNLKSIGTALIASDIHFPDESIEAIQLFLKLLHYVQPDVLLINGDIFDFDSLSTFAKHRRRRHRDALMEVENRWHRFIDEIERIAPNTQIVAQKGNHDDRFDRWNDQAGNPFSDSTEEVFVNMIRSNDRVWWLGQNQETYFGQLFIQHGKRTGDNAAKNANKDIGFSLTMVQGHNHRPATHIHRVHDTASDLGSYRVVKAVSTGTLCNIPPHYQRDTNQSKWLNGIAYSVVNLDGKDADVQNIVFHRRDDAVLWCAFGKELLFATDAKGKHIE